MRRMFLFEIVEDLQTTENLSDTLSNYMKNVRGFKDLVDIIYNPKYDYEFDKKIMATKARSTRENGGFPSAWFDVVLILRGKLIKRSNLSYRIPDYYAKACKSCNYKDVEILNYALMHRNFPGFQGAKKKKFLDALGKYEGGPDGKAD